MNRALSILLIQLIPSWNRFRVTDRLKHINTRYEWCSYRHINIQWFELNDLIRTKCSDTTEGILREVFQNFNPLCGRNPIETDLD